MTADPTDEPVTAQENVLDCVILPPGAAQALRRRLGLATGVAPRIVYLSGPGDVVGTFGHWTQGEHDPRVPVITYSADFYTLAEKLDAAALILHEHPGVVRAESGARFRFSHLARDRSGGRIRYFSQAFRFSLRARAAILGHDPHIVLFGTDSPVLLPLLLPRRLRLVLTAHNTYWPCGQPPKRETGRLRDRISLGLTGRMLRRIRGAVCTSAECARQIAALRGSDAGLFVEIPQIPLHHMPFPRDASLSGRDARHLLFLGRIEANKGVFDLLDAFESLAAAHPSVDLTFAGDGSAADTLAARIAASPHRDRIRFAGRLSGAQVHAALDGADLLICPTRAEFNEGLAMVVIEAAVHGVPSLVSSVVPARELFEGGCAVFPANDTAALRMELGRLLAEPARLGALQAKLDGSRLQFLDRSKSWGSELYRAFMA